MNLQVQPKQFLFLYNCLKKYERDFLSVEEEDSYSELIELLENHIINTLEDVDSKVKLSGFDKWLKSESNKIQGLEDELKKIKETTSDQSLLEMIKPVKKDIEVKKVRGRKRK